MAVALGERVSGSESKFAQAMPARAQALGMTKTVFRNASGLPSPQQVTTARDMTILARAIVRDYPHHYAVFATPDFTHGGVTSPSRSRGWPPRSTSAAMPSAATDGIRVCPSRASDAVARADVSTGRNTLSAAP